MYVTLPMTHAGVVIGVRMSSRSKQKIREIVRDELQSFTPPVYEDLYEYVTTLFLAFPASLLPSSSSFSAPSFSFFPPHPSFLLTSYSLLFLPLPPLPPLLLSVFPSLSRSFTSPLTSLPHPYHMVFKDITIP